MTEFDILQALKVDLGLSPTTTLYDGRLTQIIRSAIAEVKKAGASDFDPAQRIEDGQLAVVYSAWLWRNRDTQSGMPRMLQSMLHDRVVRADREQ